MTGALHLVTATLAPAAAGDGLAQALATARELRGAPGVRRVLAGRSEERLVVATWLDAVEGLDAFAASRPHMAFVMQGLAPVIRGMWSAAVESDGQPLEGATALWAFAVPAVDGVYEWQVRALLAAIEGLPGAASVGPTIEERERYRAGGLVCVADTAAFEARLAEARQAWGRGVGPLQEALVPVIAL